MGCKRDNGESEGFHKRDKVEDEVEDKVEDEESEASRNINSTSFHKIKDTAVLTHVGMSWVSGVLRKIFV